MEEAGFVALDTEWWHYSLPQAAQRFALLDLDFKQLKEVVR
jgi:D-alanyl-D-alanine dipeptidase